eukprot:Clim_evm81s88 gene=Clim_evmTU81s88
MCGIFGIINADGSQGCSQEIYEALNILQHRGQDAAGILTCLKGRLFQRKGNGMVRDVFGPQELLHLVGPMGIGHVRYPTAGSSNMSEAQPFYVNSPYGVTIAHNGNITNHDELKDFLDHTIHRHINTDSDSELMLNLLACELQNVNKDRVNHEDVFRAVSFVNERCVGAWACCGMIAGYGIYVMRDPWGIRPAVYGRRPSMKIPNAYDYCVASESVVLQALGFELVDDVKPGECIVFPAGGGMHKRICASKPVLNPCIFEYVYFARPDSIIDKISVYQARLNMGEYLAKRIKESLENSVDVVIPVPDTSRTAALQAAYYLEKPYREGFIKNRYIGRTFIMPGQAMRKKSVRRKLNAMPQEFNGKRVLLVDDSIVRGTTSKEIINMAREAGATAVYFASCAPPIRFPNVYGIDMPTSEELVAYGRTEAEVAREIGADKVFYQTEEDLKECVKKLNPDINDFDCSVFSGCYVTGNVDSNYLDALALRRSDSQKVAKDSSGHAMIVGLHNMNLSLERSPVL